MIKAWHLILSGFIVGTYGWVAYEPIPFHLGVFLVTIFSYSLATYKSVHALKGLFFLVLWYGNFEFAASYSSESLLSDWIIRFFGILPFLYMLYLTKKANNNA